MDISFIVILGLPILYLTGSIRKIVGNTGVGGLCFIMYFVITAVLSFIPAFKVTQDMRISLAGAFFCIAPAVYLAVRRRYTYVYYLAFVLTTLLSVVVSFFTNTYTLPYLPYIVVLVVAAAAVIFFKSSGPVFAPVMMGIYGIAGGLMQLLGGMENTITLFGGIGVTSLSTAVCLFAAYIIARPRGRRTRGRHEAGGSPQNA